MLRHSNFEDKVSFVALLARHADQRSVRPDPVPPPFVDARGHQPLLAEQGTALLRAGHVAILMLAGGLSTRMGSRQLRGELVIGPVSNRTILQLQGQRIASLYRRFGGMPWLVLTSPAVHQQMHSVFERENYFGVPKQDVWFVVQPTLPLVDHSGKPSLQADGTWMESPTGHGGLLDALVNARLFDRLIARGIEHVFSFQYPNVLERICDPILLGLHETRKFDVTTQAILEYDRAEPIGRLVAHDGGVRIVEYYYVNEVKRACLAWNEVPGSTGTNVFRLRFLQNFLQSGKSLPYHAVLSRPQSWYHSEL
jgi:UDP-N-acetylglucosamine pyrophosphorylase